MESQSSTKRRISHGRKAILFQAVVPIGERRSLVNAWFKIHPTHKILGPFFAGQPPVYLEISSTFVGNNLYTVGGRVPNDFVASDYIRCLDIYSRDFCSRWLTWKLPSPCVGSVLGVVGNYLFILPGVWKYGYYHMDKNTYLTTRKGYILNTLFNHETTTIEPPAGQWDRIRACAALDGEGLLIAMDGEKNNFFLYNPYNPRKNDWEICDFKDPLPKFIGETSFAASNRRLYILEVQGKPLAFLYIYDIKERKLVLHKKPLKFDYDLWSMDKWNRVVRLVPVIDDDDDDDELCFLWLGSVSYENENRWPRVRPLHYLRLKASISPDQLVNFVDNKVFHTNITDLLDCLPCYPPLFGPRAMEISVEDELPGATTAPRENSVLLQAVVPCVEGRLRMNAWFKIQPTGQVLGPFHGRRPFRLGMSSTFVGSYVYTIGGEVPSGRLRKSGYIGWLDTCSPFNGWEVGELPSPCDDPVICVYGDSLYIFTQQEGYIWNTRVNECLETRILPPKVEGEDQRQWPNKIRACAALDGRGIVIVLDGKKNNCFLYKPENNDWEPFDFKDPLPKVGGKSSFATSNERLYIFEGRVFSPSLRILGFLYIYDIKEGKLVINKMPISKFTNDWSIDAAPRLVPVADDKLCFLWFTTSPGDHKLLQYVKVKFSFNPNASKSKDELPYTIEALEEFDMEGDLLECLPCGPEQFPAAVEGKSPVDYLIDTLQKQWKDNDSQEETGTSLISGEPFQDQAEDIASPEEEGERK